MRRGLWMVLALALTGSCAEEMGDDASDSPEGEGAGGGEESGALGSIRLNLEGMDTKGRPYRLRGADFYLYAQSWDDYDGGYAAPRVLSTESNPTSGVLQATVVPGPYVVALQGAWYIERLTESGVERVQKVVLLSEPHQYTYVYQNGVTPVDFRFGVDGDLIDFRHGDVSIDVSIELPEDGDYDAGPRYDAGAPIDASVDAGRPWYDAG